MPLDDRLKALLATPDAGDTLPEPERVPRGWEPALEQSASEVTATTAARPKREESADDADLLSQVGLDADVWRVASVRRSSWQGASGNWLEAYKVSAVRRDSFAVDLEELSELRRQVSLLAPLEPVVCPPRHGGSTFVVPLADWQMGKGEGGGSAATVERIQAGVTAAVARLAELQRLGRKVERVALVGLGDLVEGCDGFYAMQQFQTDLTRREQSNVVRRLLLWTIRQFAEAGYPLVVATVAGNHGENRRKGKAYTTFGDNDDVAVFEQAADVVSAAPEAFGNPTFAIPGDDLSLTLELSGVRVGIVHGHQFGGGATPGAKVLNWWQKQALGNQTVGGAKILLSGHFHHLDINPYGERTHFQAPSLDGGSRWFREIAGVDSPPGLLTLLIGEHCGSLGWSDLQIV